MKLNKKQYATKLRHDNDFNIVRLQKMIKRLTRRNADSNLAKEKIYELNERKSIAMIANEDDFFSAHNTMIENIDKRWLRRIRK